MKKIIHMISSLNTGGAETMVKDYALLLNREQFEVTIVSLDKKYHSVNEKILEQAGIRVVYLSETRYRGDKILNVFQKIVRKIARFTDLRELIKSEKPDILHMHLDIGKYLRIIPAKAWGIKLLYTVHNVPERFFDPSGKDKKKYAAYKEISRLIIKEDLKLIVLHEGMETPLKKMFNTDKVITVNNGVNLERFRRELYNKSETRKKLGIGNNTLLIGHVGRFHEQKNHELIIWVFSELLKKESDAHLLLIGNGPLQNRIEKEIEKLGLVKNVTILQNRSDVPELMAAMDVFFFPSRWEGFGNVMIEAQNMGIPCVVSDKIHPNVIVNENVTALPLDASIDKWVDAIHSGRRGTVSDEIKKYDIENSVKVLEKIYSDENE